jgi:hypothetical protein
MGQCNEHEGAHLSLHGLSAKGISEQSLVQAPDGTNQSVSFRKELLVLKLSPALTEIVFGED